MPNRIPTSRGLFAVALLVAVVVSSTAPAAARGGAKPPADEELPQAMALLAPFACGTEWQGSTYSGHGSNNWNLDLNRSDDAGASDLGQPILAQADGVVVWFKQTGYNNHAGTYIEIDYGDVTVRYIHLVENSIPAYLAEIGARVTSGEAIGLLGATGRVSGPHLHLEYWNSAGFDDSAWYQLPRANHLPVAFDGQEMVAAPGRPSPAAVSTNCPDPIREERFHEFRLWRHQQLDAR
jgi:murein DD-endopeptidase MepM/ murein hydrolase activator NlpD